MDYETRESYSLLCTATDGGLFTFYLFVYFYLFFITKNQLFVYFFSGGQHTTTRVNINIIDVNDNYPRFEVQSYKRAIPEGKDTVVCLLFSDFCKQKSPVCLLFI